MFARQSLLRIGDHLRPQAFIPRPYQQKDVVQTAIEQGGRHQPARLLPQAHAAHVFPLQIAVGRHPSPAGVGIPPQPLFGQEIVHAEIILGDPGLRGVWPKPYVHSPIPPRGRRAFLCARAADGTL